MNNKEKVAHNKAKHEGKIFPTNYDGEVKVLEYINSKNILIEFIDTQYQKKAQLGNLLSGLIKDDSISFMHNIEGLVYGDEVGRSKLPEYSRWKSLLERCYNDKYHVNKPTYKDCTVSDNFKQFPYFKDWCNAQIGFNSKDDKGKPFHLDKDILVKGSRQYNENVCVFVPHDINTLLSQSSHSREELPLGVSHSCTKGNYVACLNKYGNNIQLGTFNTAEEAFQAYKQAKEHHVKEVANKWKGQIDMRVYETLMDWSININD